MKVRAVITDPDGYKHPLEAQKMFECLKRNKAPPFEGKVEYVRTY